jgi:hypothetical protein
MTNQQHPIKPTPDLVNQWRKRGPADATINNSYEMHIAIQAAQWGADQELEACCEWVSFRHWSSTAERLRIARRPKPPSETDQALELVSRIEKSESIWVMSELGTIRRALERLKKLEQLND